MKIDITIIKKKGFLREIYANGNLLGSIEKYKGFDGSWKILIKGEKFTAYNLSMGGGRWSEQKSYERVLKKKNSDYVIAKNYKSSNALNLHSNSFSEQYFIFDPSEKLEFKENIDSQTNFGWQGQENKIVLKMNKNKLENGIFLADTMSLNDTNVCLLIIYSLGLRSDFYSSNYQKVWSGIFIAIPIIFGIYMALNEGGGINNFIPIFIAASILPLICSLLLYTVIFNSSKFDL